MPDDPKHEDELFELLRSVRRRVGRLTVVVIFLAMVLGLTAAAVFGQLVNYFAFDPLMYGASTLGAAVVGFLLGWYAHHRA